MKNTETQKKLEYAVANPFMVDENAHVGKYELNAKDTRAYVLTEIRNKSYPNTDTGESIYVGSRGSRKTIGQGGETHRKSIIHIPEIIKGSIILPYEIPAYKKPAAFFIYKYGVGFIKMGGKSYIAKLVLGKNEREEWEYYTHTLTGIKKGSNSTGRLLTPIELITSSINDSTLDKILQGVFAGI